MTLPSQGGKIQQGKVEVVIENDTDKVKEDKPKEKKKKEKE